MNCFYQNFLCSLFSFWFSRCVDFLLSMPNLFPRCCICSRFWKCSACNILDAFHNTHQDLSYSTHCSIADGTGGLNGPIDSRYSNFAGVCPHFFSGLYNSVNRPTGYHANIGPDLSSPFYRTSDGLTGNGNHITADVAYTHNNSFCDILGAEDKTSADFFSCLNCPFHNVFSDLEALVSNVPCCTKCCRHSASDQG